MIVVLSDELNQQPEALLQLVDFYRQNTRLLDLHEHFPHRRLLLTGMGASFHAARIAAYHMNRLGISCSALEASDLVNYGMQALEPETLLVYISQSGSSGEVPAVLERLKPGISLVSITNRYDVKVVSRVSRLPRQASPEAQDCPNFAEFSPV